MRAIFPGQFLPKPDEIQQIWKECIFVVDANVLLNLYRYSTETRQELERALTSVKDQLFITHQAALEFLRSRFTVTADQAKEYEKAIAKIEELRTLLSDTKRHPFLPEAKLPRFIDYNAELVRELQDQKSALLDRLTSDDVLEFVQSIFEGKTGKEFDPGTLKGIVDEGKKRYQEQTPPGYKDAKKDVPGDPTRPYGDLIIWKQLIAEAKSREKPVVFITNDVKEDWWLSRSGRTIGPRIELREEFIAEVQKEFWIYTADKFIEEAARTSNTAVNKNVLAEIIEVREDVKAEQCYEAEVPYLDYIKDAFHGLSMGRRSIVTKIVTYLGIDTVISSTPDQLVSAFKQLVYETRATGIHPYAHVNGGAFTGLRTVGIIDDADELTPVGVTIFKTIAIDIKVGLNDGDLSCL